MDDRKLTKISFVIAIFGLVSLFSLTQILQPESLSISELKDSDVGKVVTTNAVIGSINNKDNNLFLTLSDGDSELRAVYWYSDAKNSPEAYNLKKGDSVSVTGQIEIYRGELEIIVKKVSLEG